MPVNVWEHEWLMFGNGRSCSEKQVGKAVCLEKQS